MSHEHASPEPETVAEEQTGGGRRPSPCCRIADPEGKHLEVCRLQLANVVDERDACRPWIEWCCYEWQHRPHIMWPSDLLKAARALKIIPDNTLDRVRQ